MPVTYDLGTKTARMLATRDRIDSGTGPGIVQLGTAGMGTVVATIELADPCGTVVDGALTFSGFPRTDISADADGAPVAAQILTSSGTVIVSGLTAGRIGPVDILLDDDYLHAGQTFVLKSLVITHGG